MTAVVATALLLIAALVVDIGNTWSVRGDLQAQADGAAIYGADALPVILQGDGAATSQLTAARRVAYHIACHPVRGQGSLNDIPDCPEPTAGRPGAQDPSLTGFAQRLLDDGHVTFPSTTQIRVQTPAARVDYGFGGLAGADGTVQDRTATAAVYSPGTPLPTALSMSCLLSGAGTAPAGLGDLVSGVAPINYIAPGPIGGGTPEASQMPVLPAGDPAVTLDALSPDQTSQTSSGAQTIATASGLGNLISVVGLTVGPDVKLHFYRSGQPAITADASLVGLALGPLPGTLTFAVPAAVTSQPGTWYVKISTRPNGQPETARRFSTDTLTYTVTLPPGAADLLACSSLTDSPREDTNNRVEAQTLRRNLAEGNDHGLVVHPALATLSPPGPAPLVESVLTTLNNGLLDCAAAPASVVDGPGVNRNPVPNCTTSATGTGYDIYQEFTAGMLSGTDQQGRTFHGRLDCAENICSHDTLTLDGFPGTYNADQLADYINDPSLLNSAMLFSLSTYLTNDLPLITPDRGLLDEDIYTSPRFAWTAVISNPQPGALPAATGLSPTGCAHCPVLTYRPVFLTSQTPDTLPVLDLFDLQLEGLGALLGTTTTALLSTLYPELASGTAEEAGLILDENRTLRAVRFATLEPTALPAVGPDYNGPVTDYLGTGPRVTRLVQ